VTRVGELVIAARAGIENLSPSEVADELARGDVLLVDVREAEEAARGTLLGAVVLPRGLLEWAELDPRRRVVLISAVGSRSALAASTLHALGHRDVAHLDGGYRRWAAEGRPTTADEGS
jgi:rhodanese-related sulfurtransferase